MPLHTLLCAFKLCAQGGFAEAAAASDKQGFICQLAHGQKTSAPELTYQT